MSEAKQTEQDKTETPDEEKVRVLTQTLQRVQADFENYRKRTQNEFTQHYLRGKASALKEMLAFVDTLDAAVSHADAAHQTDLGNVRKQFLQILSQNGVKAILPLGKTFDPFTSECVMQESDQTKNEDVVVEEFQKGYFFHDEVLRPAKVKVNKKIENEEKKNNQPLPMEGGKQYE
jgi:molecular chaperone GrpE